MMNVVFVPPASRGGESPPLPLSDKRRPIPFRIPRYSKTFIHATLNAARKWNIPSSTTSQRGQVCSVENPQLHRQLGRIMHYEHYNQIANCCGAAGFDRRSQDIARLCQPLQPQTLHTTPTLRLLDSQGLFQDRLPWHRPTPTRSFGPPTGAALDAHSAFHHAPKGQCATPQAAPRPAASPCHRAAVSRPSPTGATSCL